MLEPFAANMPHCCLPKGPLVYVYQHCVFLGSIKEKLFVVAFGESIKERACNS